MLHVMSVTPGGQNANTLARLASGWALVWGQVCLGSLWVWVGQVSVRRALPRKRGKGRRGRWWRMRGGEEGRGGWWGRRGGGGGGRGGGWGGRGWRDGGGG